MRAASAQPVAGASHGLDRFGAERAVHLLAQVADVDIDDVRAVLVLVVPRVLEQLEAGEHLPGRRMNDLEQRELLGRQRDLGVAAPYLPSRRVEAEVTHLEQRGPLDRAAAGQRSQAGKELGERERLQQVVVGAAVEPSHPVGHGVPRGEHQHRRPDPVLAQPPARLEPVDPREHDVEHDRVVLARRGAHQRLLPLARLRRRPARLPRGRASRAPPSSARPRRPGSSWAHFVRSG